MNVESLKTLFEAIGGDPADVAETSTIVGVLNAISGVLGGATNATTNAEAIANIAAVAGGIVPDYEDIDVTPTTSEQEITASSGKTLRKVTVAAVTAAIDSDIVAENIKDGVDILGVTGSYTG
mgnify:CR=1 FL=1